MGKFTKKALTQLLLTLAITSLSLSDQCGNNCYYCLDSGQCAECYERKVTQDSQGNYAVCSSTPQPASDKCLLYLGDACTQYKPGWAEDKTGEGEALKSTIQNCVNENVEYGRHNCAACSGGWPSQDLSKCIPASKLSGAIPKCTVGVLQDNGILLCAQCEAGDTSDSHTCVKTPASLTGCLLSNEVGCVVCDAKNGYFMRAPNACSKNTSSA